MGGYKAITIKVQQKQCSQQPPENNKLRAQTEDITDIWHTLNPFLRPDAAAVEGNNNQSRAEKTFKIDNNNRSREETTFTV